MNTDTDTGMSDTPKQFPRPERTRIIVVANQKGGVGKTTTTVNLAASLALHGARVLVIDLDPQGNASTALGIDHHVGVPSTYEVLVGDDDKKPVPIAEIVQQCPNHENLLCVPATIDLAGAELELVSVVARENRLEKAITKYLNHLAESDQALDYILIDCPPSLGLLTLNALTAAREVLIPMQTEYYALEGLSQLLKNVDLVQGALNDELWVSTVLLTMYDARTNLAASVAEEVREHFPKQTLNTKIPRSIRVSEAPSFQQTAIQYDPSGPASLAYVEAARELAVRGAQ